MFLDFKSHTSLTFFHGSPQIWIRSSSAPTTLHSPVHRLAGEPGARKHGLSLQLQRQLQQGNVPQLSQEPLHKVGYGVNKIRSRRETPRCTWRPETWCHIKVRRTKVYEINKTNREFLYNILFVDIYIILNISEYFTVFHYQVKVHFFGKTKLSYTDQPMKISLYGIHGEKENIPYIM